MSYILDDRLVIGVASSALFDLGEADRVFREQGEAAYRKYQEEHLEDILQPGVAFQFVKRILQLNDLSPDMGDPLVEVVIMSRNDPDTGLRVMRSVSRHSLAITRAIFTAGRSPYEFISPFNISLYLSADDEAVRAAVEQHHPAGLVLVSVAEADDSDQLRIAFDFDGILTDDSAEQIFQSGGISAFHASESEHANETHPEGLLLPFLKALSRIQTMERERCKSDDSYRRRLSISVVTSRNAPAHERVILSLKAWEVQVDNAFFLGGVDKGRVMQVLKPHIFFDDQESHLIDTSKYVPSVHVPFGELNRRSAEKIVGEKEVDV
ncbi:5'-nucleotidase [Nocardia sputi]|uniref:5'-nucleotidase n=1 Tax=Nocardia sputi TaxID=2943705 RepID=UPI0020C03EF4|nr:5'-nucleotidase [Nocardia sputi]